MLSLTTFEPAWASISIVMVENGTNTPPVIFTSAKTSGDAPFRRNAYENGVAQHDTVVIG